MQLSASKLNVMVKIACPKLLRRPRVSAVKKMRFDLFGATLISAVSIPAFQGGDGVTASPS